MSPPTKSPTTSDSSALEHHLAACRFARQSEDRRRKPRAACPAAEINERCPPNTMSEGRSSLRARRLSRQLAERHPHQNPCPAGRQTMHHCPAHRTALAGVEAIPPATAARATQPRRARPDCVGFPSCWPATFIWRAGDCLRACLVDARPSFIGTFIASVVGRISREGLCVAGLRPAW